MISAREAKKMMPSSQERIKYYKEIFDNIEQEIKAAAENDKNSIVLHIPYDEYNYISTILLDEGYYVEYRAELSGSNIEHKAEIFITW